MQEDTSDPRPSRSTATPARPVYSLPVAISLGILAIVLWQSPNFGHHNNNVGSPIAGDFLQEWIGAYALRTVGPEVLFDHSSLSTLQHDESLLGFRWTESEYFEMVYPPFYYMLWIPASFLPYSLAAWLFVLAMIGCLIAAHMLMVKAIGRCETGASNDGTLRNILPWLLVLATMYTPLIRSITTGQKGTVCLLILAATFFLYMVSRRFASGLAFGLMAFKPHLALLVGISMFLKRQWAFVIGALLVAGLFGGMCFLAGPQTCWNYAQFCVGAGDYVETSGYDLYKSHCLYGFFALLGGGTSTWLTRASWILAVGLIGILLLRMNSLNKETPDSVRKPIEFSVLVLATLLVTPHLFSYDLCMLLLPMYLLVGLMANGAFSRRQSMRIGFLLGALYLTSGFSHFVAAVYGVQLTTVLMFALLWVLCREKPAIASTRSESSGVWTLSAPAVS
ncbi:MAG: glycosyltransferase family 87 protein [Pirellulaceae bacterium]